MATYDPFQNYGQQKMKCWFNEKFAPMSIPLKNQFLLIMISSLQLIQVLNAFKKKNESSIRM